MLVPILGLAFERLTYMFHVIGGFLLAIAPALIILSFAVSALMWVMAGHSSKLAHRAKEQFVATCVATALIGSYFVLRAVVSAFGMGSF
jgi:hypothetical protein